MTIDAATLDIAVEEREHWRRHMRVTVPADHVREERERITREFSGRLRLPGFRKGKIPSDVVEKQLGPSIDQELMDRVVGDAFRIALERETLRPISQGEVEDIQFQPGKDLTFAISFDVEPQIEFARLSGFTVNRPPATVSEDDVTAVLERLRVQNGSWAPGATDGSPSAEHLVNVEIQPLDDGEDGEVRPYEFVLGQGEAIPDVEEAIQTLAPGESGDFTVRFPDDFPNEERRGDEQRLRITLTSWSERELPELDDAFARTVGPFESLDDLESKVREDLTREAEKQAEGAVRGQLLDFVAQANPFDVPRSMVERYVDSVIGEQEVPEERRAQIHEQLGTEAEMMVKRFLIIDRIADMKELRATEDDLDDRVETIAERTSQNPSQVYAELQKSGRLSDLERDITETKVFDYLKSESEITTSSS